MDYKATLQSTVKNVPVQVQAVQSAGAPHAKWSYTHRASAAVGHQPGDERKRLPKFFYKTVSILVYAWCTCKVSALECPRVP